MKYAKAVLTCLILTIAVVAQNGGAPPKAIDAAKPPVLRAVTVAPVLISDYTAAQKRLEDARKAVEASPAWKDYLISQTQLQTMLIFVMAETGLKPSEECKPVFTKEGTLERFDCPVKEAKTDKKP